MITLWRLDPVTLEPDEDPLSTFARRWTDDFPGSASFAVHIDNPQAAGLARGTLVRFDLDEVPAFLAVLVKPTVKPLSRQRSGRVVEWSCRGVPAQLAEARIAPPYAGEGRLNTVRVLDGSPPDQRIFGWVDPAFDDSAWSPAMEQDPSHYGSDGGEPFVDPAAAWIHSEDTSDDSPAGVTIYRRVITLDEGWYLADAMWDDRGIVWVDGIEILSDLSAGFRGQHTQAEVWLDEGEHTFGLWSDNTNALKAGARFALVPLTAGGDVDLPAAVHTDDTWVTPGYVTDNEPGYSPHELIALWVAEAQAEGQLAGWSLTSTAAEDSKGEPWAGPARMTCEIGQDLGAALAALAETYADVWVAPDALELSLANPGTGGDTTTVGLAKGVNLADDGLAHEGDPSIVNDLLVRYAEGWARVADAASIAAHGRQCATLRLDGVHFEAEAERIAQASMILDPRWSTTATVLPVGATDRPYVDWRRLDWIACPDETGDLVPQRVRTLSVDETPKGRVRFVAELRDVTLEVEVRIRQWLSRAALGTLAGRSASAIFGTDRPPRRSSRDTEKIEPFTIEGAITDGTEVQMLHDGVLFGSPVTVNAADEFVAGGETSEQFAINELLAVQVTPGGGSAQVSYPYPMPKPTRIVGMIVTSRGDGAGLLVQPIGSR